MERINEVEVMSIALVILHEASKQPRGDDPDVRIPWRSIDALADSFRKGGVDIPAQLGTTRGGQGEEGTPVR